MTGLWDAHTTARVEEALLVVCAAAAPDMGPVAVSTGDKT